MYIMSISPRIIILWALCAAHTLAAEAILPEQLLHEVQASLSAQPRKYVKYEWQAGTAEIGEHWLETPNEGGPDVLISKNGGDFIFPVDARLEWHGNRTLQLEVHGNIIFNAGVMLRHTGANGGLILATYNLKSRHVARELDQGTVDFSKASGCCLDFSESQGALSILYNPPRQDSGSNKYAHPIDFNAFISKNKQTWFKAYMLVHNERDSELMAKQKVGDYALASYRVKSKKFHNFTGTINKNGWDFQGPFYDGWSLYPTLEHFLFEERLPSSGVWGPDFFKVAPPLYGRPLSIFTEIESSDQAKIDSVLGSSLAENFACVRGADLKTPLHIAAEVGNLAALELIWQSTYRTLGRNFIDRPDANGKTAFELAVLAAKVEAVKLMVNLYQKAEWAVDFQAMAQSAEQLQARISHPNEEIARLLKDQDLLPVDISAEWRAFPNGKHASSYDYRSAQKAHDRFFLRDTSSLMRLQTLYRQFDVEYGKIGEASSFSPAPGVRSLNIDGIPSRSRIMLMRYIFERKLRTRNNPSINQAKYWRDGTNPGQLVDRHALNFVFGGATHTFESQPTTAKPGYAYYKQIGAYDGAKDDAIKGKIAALSLLIAPKKIAQLLTNSRVSGNAIDADALFAAGYSGDNADADATYLNRFILLWDLEVASRLIRSEGPPSDFERLPIGTGIARAQSCIAAKTMDYIPFLTNSSGRPGPVHIFCGSAEERAAAISKISAAREGQLSSSRNRQRLSIFVDENPNWRTAATAERHHQELLKEYGGGYESSGEPYSPIP